jgi:hypothetical protein
VTFAAVLVALLACLPPAPEIAVLDLARRTGLTCPVVVELPKVEPRPTEPPPWEI